MQLIPNKIRFFRPFWFMHPRIDKFLTAYKQPVGCFHVSESHLIFFPHLITSLSGVMLTLCGQNDRQMGEGEKEGERGGKRVQA